MRKFYLLSILGVFLLVGKGQAQGFSFITSFGVEHHWGIPYEVYYTLDHQYYGHNLVHARRAYHHGRLFFDLILQRGDVFVNVRVNPQGRVYRSVLTYDYPLYDHVCGDFCGYHRDYYVNYRVSCSGHHHYGHNHVVYRPNVVVYNKHNHYPHGYAYYKKNNHGHGHGHYKKEKSYYEDHDRDNDRSHRINYNNRYQSRRSGNGNYRSSGSDSGGGHHSPNIDRGRRGNGNNGVRDHGRGVGRGQGNDKGQGKKNNGRYDRGSNGRSNARSTQSSVAYRGRRTR